MHPPAARAADYPGHLRDLLAEKRHMGPLTDEEDVCSTIDEEWQARIVVL